VWRNYVTVGWRALIRNKTYAFINVFGLATGLAACLLLLLYVRYETTYDRWLPDSERVFQVQSVGTGPEDAGTVMQATHGIITESLAREFPEIEAISRADGEQLVLVRNGEPVFASAFLVDPSFFDVLQLPFLRGDRRTALARMDGVVLSRTEAIRQFGSIDVIGRTITGIRRGEQYAMQVTGVFEDVPRNSHLDLSMVRRITDEERAS
jgi:putative ABC transport system permease protein